MQTLERIKTKRPGYTLIEHKWVEVDEPIPLFLGSIERLGDGNLSLLRAYAYARWKQTGKLSDREVWVRFASEEEGRRASRLRSTLNLGPLLVRPL